MGSILQILLYFLVILLFVEIIHGQGDSSNCTQYIDCQSCVWGSVECIWCIISFEGNCVPGTITGSPVCDDYNWGQCWFTGHSLGTSDTYIIVLVVIIFIIFCVTCCLVLCCCSICKRRSMAEKKGSKDSFEMGDTAARTHRASTKEHDEYEKQRKDMLNKLIEEKENDKGNSNSEDRPPPYGTPTPRVDPEFKPPTPPIDVPLYPQFEQIDSRIPDYTSPPRYIPPDSRDPSEANVPLSVSSDSFENIERQLQSLQQKLTNENTE